MRVLSFLILVAAAAATACGGGHPDGTVRSAGPDGGEPTAAPALEPEDEGADMLETPFTAAQIRDEWVEGFAVTMQRSAAGETRLERWTVIAADPEGADIQYAALDAGGGVLGEPVVARSTWNELRDHALFKAAAATREPATRDTALGPLEGWVYRVQEDDPGTISELFFAASLPGAPVQMTTYQDGEAVFELQQVARYRPPAP